LIEALYITGKVFTGIKLGLATYKCLLVNDTSFYILKKKFREVTNLFETASYFLCTD